MKKLLFILILLFSTSLFSQWIIQPGGTNSALRQITFYDDNTGWACGDGGVILKTTNGGVAWLPLTSGSSQNLYSIAAYNSSILIACGSNGTIIRTTNAGASWVSVTGGTANNLNSVSIDFSKVYAAGANGTIVSSSDQGITWHTENSNTTNQINCLYFFDSQTGFFTGAAGNNGVFKYNMSNSWVDINGFPSTVENFTGSTINFAANGRLVWFVSTESGKVFKGGTATQTWLQTNSGVTTPLYSVSNQNQVYDNGYISDRRKVWAVGAGGVIRYSADTGHSFGGQLSNVTSDLYSIFMHDSLNGWIAGAGGIILHTSNGGGPVIGIQQISSEIPSNFVLFQNYPNPFNPNTKIKFQISKLSNAKLVVFDILGKEVSTLVNEKLVAGTYAADFDGTKLASGIYFYRLITGDFTETKKMILVK